jgi:hypothetical protein
MRLGLVALLLVAAAAHASDSDEDVRYRPPEGFAGHKWGDQRSSFERLPARPLGVGAAWMRVQEKQTGYSCQLTTWLPKYIESWIPQCKYQETLLRPQSVSKGGGSYVVSEYAIDGQGFLYGDETAGVVLHPVIYQFCANWKGGPKRPPPKNFDEINRFCGVKLMFESETAEELAKLPADHVTAYDRLLEKLIARYGRPLGYARRGKVIVAPVEGEATDEGQRRYSTWRWCPAGDGFRTQCAASLTLAFDPVSGVGAAMYSTPVLWEFAFARENYGFKGDPLYKVLHHRD